MTWACAARSISLHLTLGYVKCLSCHLLGKTGTSFVLLLTKDIYIESGLRLKVSSIDDLEFEPASLGLPTVEIKSWHFRERRLISLCLSALYLEAEITSQLIDSMSLFTEIMELIRFSHSWEILWAVQETFRTSGNCCSLLVSRSSSIRGSGLKHLDISWCSKLP